MLLKNKHIVLGNVIESIKTHENESFGVANVQYHKESIEMCLAATIVIAVCFFFFLAYGIVSYII